MIDDEPAPDGPWRSNKMHVLNRKCSTCIFRPGNLMHLNAGRVEQMVTESLSNNSAIVCHATLDGPQSICRGFYDRHRRDTLTLRLATAMDVYAFDDPPKGH